MRIPDRNGFLDRNDGVSKARYTQKDAGLGTGPT